MRALRSRAFGLKNTDGTESIDTIVTTSAEHPSISPILSIFESGGSSGNSDMRRPRSVRSPVLLNAPSTHSCARHVDRANDRHNTYNSHLVQRVLQIFLRRRIHEVKLEQVLHA